MRSVLRAMRDRRGNPNRGIRALALLVALLLAGPGIVTLLLRGIGALFPGY